MEYINLVIYFALFTLAFFIMGYNMFYSYRVGGVSQRLGIELPQTLKRFLNLIAFIAFISLLIIGFFLILSIPPIIMGR